jgi:hypothetical protein
MIINNVSHTVPNDKVREDKFKMCGTRYINREFDSRDRKTQKRNV